MLRRAAEAVVLGSALLAAWGPAHGQDLLEPEQAFRVEARMTGPQTLAVTWRIADGHYMYRQAFSLSAPRGGVILGEPSFPEGNNRHDEFFGDVVTFEDDVTFTVPVTPIANGLSRFDLRATGQGCNEPLGVCYPPLTRDLVVDMDTAGGAPAQSMMSEVPGAAAAGDATQALFGGGSNQAGFLHPDEAFRFELSAMGGDALLVRFSIEPGYYLYKDRFSVSSGDPDVRVESIQLPEGRSKTDEYFGDTVVYYDGFDAQASLQRDSGEARTASFNVGFQGCADGGICYPPSEKTVSVRLPAAGEDAAAPGALSQGQGDARSGAWALVLAFGAGLLLTFTPCVCT
ncbi:MAG TPA: protein-disulfide reductase DsbD domain-containing protein [Arenicellales bacterium]|nr:protein-disulfide reductase DsbD domain-containing protein [Arenicellales bacterium]